MKNLLIVESPAKAKTIEKYLGKDFKVKSSYGHIRDLDKGNKGVDIANKFQPSYVVSAEKERIVKELKTAAKKAEEVWLATDEDREGEAISWHLCEVLGLPIDDTKRIVFREITKNAIQNAIKEPRRVDKNLVNAQQARRILDRLVGFELSGVLWRKVKNKLSAGRVQSVAVKLIVEREREIEGFIATAFFKLIAIFLVKDKNGRIAELKADLPKKFESEAEATKFLENCKAATYSIANIEVKPSYRKPAAPFTTSTLQQEASRKLGFNVNRTMSTAQRLYEQGLISYMRTDSTALSSQAVNAISERIVNDFGDKYLEVRTYKSKSSNAQEAHEAIRPTNFELKEVSRDRDQQRLYDLIWKRTVASQMSKAELEKTKVTIDISTIKDQKLQANGEVLIFDGFLKVYMESKDEDAEADDNKGILPPLSVGQVLDLDHMLCEERFTKPPARYTEASLVKKLEELGIGRPSTYAPTISKIMEKGRGYVTKESREGYERKYRSLTLKDDNISDVTKTETTGATSNRLYSSDIGKIVTDFLSKHFDQIMNYNFTAGIEEQFDQIADGEKQWQEILDQFYAPFHETVEDTTENAAREKGRRELGKDPETGYTVQVQMGRYGPVAMIGTVEEVGEDGKPKFANLKVGQSIETITYDEVMELFQLPKDLGEYQGKDVIIGAGRYGPYVKYDEKFISIPRGEDPLELSKDRAIELIEIKRKEDAPLGTYKGLPYTRGKGRFGPFLKYNDMFINIPKRYDADNISTEDAHELIQKKIEKEANRYIQRWPEEKIDLENGRWGPFIRFKKKSIKLPRKEGNERYTSEEAKDFELDWVKGIIEQELPGSFKKAEKKKKK